MSPRIKEFISLSIVVLFALLILKNIYFNLATFDKLTFLDGRTKDSAVQPIVSAPEPDNKNIGDNINRLEFPKDEGEHKSLQSEWWYFAGHLEDEDNPANKFGVTLIFQKNPPQIKFNLSDGVNQKNFSSVINLDSYDLLGGDKLVIKEGDIYWLEEKPFQYKIHFKFGDKEINFNLTSLKNPFLSSNNEDTFYYQQTRLAVDGQLFFSPEEKYNIKGTGWIDHQGFKGPVPWKSWRWHSLQLYNNVEMAFISDFTSGSGNFYEKNNLFIFENGASPKIVESQKYKISDLEYWQDPETKIRYPIKWRLEIPERNINLVATALIPDQVIKGADGFYEGTCQVTGIYEGRAVSGRAQFENMP